MPTVRQIKRSDDSALVDIIQDYIRGHSIDEVALRLKEQCDKFDIACKSRYQAIKRTDADYNLWLDTILDELSIGGAQLHLMTVATARNRGYYHCYVWNDHELVYLQSQDTQITVPLREKSILTKAITVLSQTKTTKTLHLFAEQIDELITSNSTNKHIPNTTDRNFIERCKSSKNLYGALKKLKLKHPRLSTLLNIIDEAKPTQTWWMYLLLAAGLTALTGFVYYLIENFAQVRTWIDRILPIVSNWFQNTINLLKKTPIIGIVSNAVVLLNAWYQAIMDDSITDTNQLITLTFKTAEHSLPIAGYVLCYLAAGTMTIPAVSMFIASAVFDVVESLYMLIYHQVGQYFNPLPPASEYHSATAKACADNTRQRNLYLSLVTIAANLITTAAVVIWCIFPPSLIIALPCVLVSILIGFTKNSLVSHLKDSYAHSLQSDLKDIGDQYRLSTHTKKDIETLELRQEILELKQRNLVLTTERDTIQVIREADQQKWMRFFPNNPASSAANSPLNQELGDDNEDNFSYNNGI